MSITRTTAINAKTISVNGVPINGSGNPTGPYTTFDQLDESVAVYLNGTPIQGTPNPLVQVSQYTDINVLSGLSLGGTIAYGTASTPGTNAATGPISPPKTGGSVTLPVAGYSMIALRSNGPVAVSPLSFKVY